MTNIKKPFVLRPSHKKMRDVAFLYRMPAGIPGDVNRAWAGTTIEPNVMYTAAPLLAYGLAGVLDAATGQFRGVGASDAIGDLYGILVRPYPLNVQTANKYFGTQLLTDASIPPISGPIDVLKRGYILVQLNAASAAAVKGAPAYVWGQATSGGHTQGGWEGASGGSALKAPAYFMGAADANGNVEIAWNL